LAASIADEVPTAPECDPALGGLKSATEAIKGKLDDRFSLYHSAGKKEVL
jgi:hypothetical protein